MRRLSTTSVLLTLIAASGLFFQVRPQSKPAPTPIRISKPDAITVFKDEVPVGATPEQKVRLDSFLKVWNTLNENYFDRTFNGLDWNKVKIEYRPRVLAAKSDNELNQILDELIHRLDRSHFAIIPLDVFKTVEAAKREARKRGRQLAAESRRGFNAGKADLPDDSDDIDFFDENSRFGIGVDLRMLDGRFVITSVDPRSAAQLAGIKRGYIVDKINGVSVSEMVRRITFSYPNLKNLNLYLPLQIVSWFLDGTQDSQVTVTCLDEHDQAREFRMSRMRLTGSAVSIGSNYPPQFLDFETRSLDADTGYIKFNLFSLAVIEKLCGALTEFKDKKGIVLDLRGNLGGVIGVLNGVSGMLTDRFMNFGTSIYRRGPEPFDVLPKAKHFTGRLVILVDNQSISAAEIFSSGMRENDRVLLVGTTTAGEALPAGSIELPTGAIFMFPLANFKSKNGKSIEGVGVDPDFSIPLDRGTLLKDVDAPLEKAVSLIRENKDFPVSKRNEVYTGLSTGLDAGPPPPKPTPKPVPKMVPMANGDEPPPPPRASGLGNGTGAIVPPPPVGKAVDVKDERSLQVIAEFLKTMNADEFKNLKSYEAKGAGKLGVRGSSAPIGIAAYREFPGKFAFTIQLESAGEIREVHNGKVAFVESDFGMQRDLSTSTDLTAIELFGSIATLFDLSNFSSLKYLGVFDRDGRKSHVIEGKYRYLPIALAFDVETKMLVSFSSFGSTAVYGDYRKVGGIMLPYHIAIERTYDLDMTEIKLNVPVDEVHFKKKENCFDKPL